MYKSVLRIFLVLFNFSWECRARVAPDFIQPCEVLTSECLKTSIQKTMPIFVKGIPELKINVTDPMFFDYQEVDLPGKFKIIFYNGRVTGLRNCVVDTADIDLDKNYGEVSIHCNISIKGKYKATGRILIVTINGDGDAKLKINNIMLRAKMWFENKEVNGKTYYLIKKYKMEHTFQDRVSFTLTNLFKGSPQISEAVLTFLNANWKQVADEFGGPIVDTIGNRAFEAIMAFFKAVPKNEILNF